MKRPNRQAINAFNHTSNAPWKSDDLANEDFPVYIWYDFPQPVFPANISFLPRQESTNPKTAFTRVPRTFDFVGSNAAVCNAGASWTDLCTVNKTKQVTSLSETSGCEIEASQIGSAKFRCLGLRIYSDGLAGSGSGSSVGVALSYIRIWVRDLE